MMSKDYNIESHALTVETEAVEQVLKENGKAKKQIKGKTTIERLKPQTYCLMKARAGHVSEADKISYSKTRCQASNGAVVNPLD